MNVPKETLTKIETVLKVINRTEETLSRVSKLFSCVAPDGGSAYIEVGGNSVHCTVAPETKEEADILQQAIELVLNNRLIKAHSYLNTVIKEN